MLFPLDYIFNSLIFNFDFVDSLSALGIAQASLALLSFAKEFNLIIFSFPIKPFALVFVLQLKKAEKNYKQKIIDEKNCTHTL